MSLRPAPDEIEISIFGKGFGECVVIHLCDDQWIIVDSFKDPFSKRPIALEYLKSLNVDCGKTVQAIVATHWHDDHICGLSDIVRECPHALFICSEAFQRKEFLEFVFSDSDLKDEARPGVRELRSILEELKIRKGTIVRAIENRVLINNPKYKIHALSPSDYAVSVAQREIIALLPKELQPRKGISVMNPNYAGIALLVCVDGQNFLLGSDLEEPGDDRLGWSKVLNSPGRPTEKSTAFKIPHHGSETAHHEGIWSDLLEKQPFSALTSFVLGDCLLPKKRDMKRILKTTDKVWITTNPFVKKKAHKRDGAVEKTIKETVKTMRSLSDRGQIRMRLDRHDKDCAWKVELFDSAIPLNQCLMGS